MAYRIAETCIGCTACTKRCPTGAISGWRDVVHVIDPGLCIDCGACGVVCPPEAIVDDRGDACRTFARKEWPKAIVVEDNCIGSGCELCIQLCPFEALRIGQPTRTRRDFFGIAVLNERKCTGCRLCEDACGWGAIYIDPPRELLKKAAWPDEERPVRARDLAEVNKVMNQGWSRHDHRSRQDRIRVGAEP